MTARNLRAELASDATLGTGNAFSTVAAKLGDATGPVLTFDTEVDGHPAWHGLNVRDLSRCVNARAAWLFGQGIRPRDPVAVYVTSAADQVLAFLALTRIGAIPALVNSMLDGETARAYISKVAPRALLTDADHRAALGDYPAAGVLRADVADAATGEEAQAPPQYRYAPDDAVVITHSSGTTGLPKAVTGTHASLFASIRHRLTLPRQYRIDRMLSALPTNHAAMVIALNTALCSESELLTLSRLDGLTVLKAIEAWRPSSVFGFAATWPQILAHRLPDYRLDSVQLWWNTGDCAHEAHIRKLVSVGHRMVVTVGGIERQTGASFMDNFGSTEMGHSMFFITHTAQTSRYNRCIGKPHAFAEVTVLDDQGDPLPPGQVGQLGVRAPTLSPGYWNDSAMTYQSRRSGYFLTGDLVWEDEAGYFYHVDRSADAVSLGDGRALYTAQSEERILAACPEILDCTVVAVSAADGAVATSVMLTISPEADPAADHAPKVLAALEDHVAATVRKVEVVDDAALPHGPTGKVRKVRLRERHPHSGERAAAKQAGAA